MKLLCIILYVIVACFLLVDSQDLGSIIDHVDRGVGYTFDIVTEEIVRPLLEWHYETGKTGKYNGRLYSVPDELFLNPQFSISNTLDFIFLNSTDSYINRFLKRTTLYKSTVFDNEFLVYAFNTSRTRFDALIDNGHNEVVVNSNTIQMFKLSMYPLSEDVLDPVLKQEMEKLPMIYDSYKYLNFISLFGTHYFIDTQYGGRVNFTLTFDNTLFDEHSPKWVATQVNNTLSRLLWLEDVDSPLAREADAGSDSFQNKSSLISYLVGGDDTQYYDYGYRPWISDLGLNSTYGLLLDLSFLQPISYLFQSNQARRMNMERAIIDYAKLGKRNDPRQAR